MRILKISYEFPPLGGGGSKVVFGLGRELVRLGHEVDLVTMGFKGLPSFEMVDGINVHRVPCIRLSESICRPWEMASYMVPARLVLNRIIKKKPYDINHTHFIFPDGVLSSYLSRSKNLPFVVTAHGSDVPGYNPNRFIALHRWLGPLWRRVVGDARRVVSPSHNLADLIHVQDPQIPVTVIPNGIDLQEFDLSKRGHNRVLVVSRIFERKGVQYLLQALEGLQVPLTLDIVGEGPYLDDLKQIASRINTRVDIHFHGWVEGDSSRYHEFFEKSNIFVLPSQAENFPVVLLEAMSASLAIITTLGTGCAEVVGNAAVLVPPLDPDAIKSALLDLYEYPAKGEGLGAAARGRLERRFVWPVVADQYLQVYGEVVN